MPCPRCGGAVPEDEPHEALEAGYAHEAECGMDEAGKAVWRVMGGEAATS